MLLAKIWDQALSFKQWKSTSKHEVKNCINLKGLCPVFNPYRLLGLNLCKAWGAPPLEKAIENYRYRVEMHVHSPIFHGQLKEKKLGRQF